MSIDAIIDEVEYPDDGSVRLVLGERPGGSIPGQKSLRVINPPEDKTELGILKGLAIWGGAGEVLLGDVPFAKRIGYTRLEMRHPLRLP